VDLRWEQQQHDYPHSAQDYVQHTPASAMDERSMQHQQFYATDGTRMPPPPPPPSAPYAWPVDAYELDPEHAQHHLQQQQQQQHQQQHREQHPHYQQQQQYAHGTPGMYPHPQHAAAYQAHNAELAQLGLAARDSRLDERWSTFMEDSGLLEGIDFRGR